MATVPIGADRANPFAFVARTRPLLPFVLAGRFDVTPFLAWLVLALAILAVAIASAALSLARAPRRQIADLRGSLDRLYQTVITLLLRMDDVLTSAESLQLHRLKL